MHEITCEDLKNKTTQYRLIDVRTPEEYVGELGHIKGTELIPMGEKLIEFLKITPHEAVIVFVCRSGARSGQTTLLSEEMGFTNTYNMVGGMLRWNELGYETERGTNL